MARGPRLLAVTTTLGGTVPPASFHSPVLLNESLSYLITSLQGVYVDATLGGGGHAEALLQRLDESGTVVGFDVDSDALKATAERLSRYGARPILIQENFRDLKRALTEREIEKINGVLFDLGVSSHQLDEASRGFTFRSDERLDMRMDRRQTLDACHVVNHYGERELAEIIWKYGEEKHSRKIARAIVRQREEALIVTTGQLAKLLGHVVGERFLTKSLARVFQAIRIEVNNELEYLHRALEDAIQLLVNGGRIVVISYHSLEDRIIKDVFKQLAATSIPSGNRIVPDTIVQPVLKVLTKKPVVAGEKEIRANPRARSAKMRAAEKVVVA